MKLYAVVPVYNVEPYIGQFLNSLAAQECEDVAYVLVNDGSTDLSGDICQDYARKDCRFHLINQPNAGVSAARNVALNYIETLSKKGDYVVFFDPDDYLTSPKAISSIASELQDKPELLLYNYTTNKLLSINNIHRGGVILHSPIGEVLFPWILLGKQYQGVTLTASLFRGAFSYDIIAKHKLQFRTDIRKSEDTLFYARFLTFVSKVKLSTITPYNYRIRPNSLTTTHRPPVLDGCVKGISILHEFEQYAMQCHGIDRKLVADYFDRRYVSLVINFVAALLDSRAGKTPKEVRIEIEKLYRLPELQERIMQLRLPANNMQATVETWIVINRKFLVQYGYAINKMKSLIRKMR